MSGAAARIYSIGGIASGREGGEAGLVVKNVMAGRMSGVGKGGDVRL